MTKAKSCSKCGADRSGSVCPKCGHQHKRGGARPNAGQKKRAIVAPVPIDGRTHAGRNVAGRVLDTVHAENVWISLVELEKRRLGIGSDGKLMPIAKAKSLIEGELGDTVISGPDYKGNFSIIPLVTLLRYLEDRHLGKTVDNVNHIHNKPIEHNVNVSLSEKYRAAIARAEQRVANR